MSFSGLSDIFQGQDDPKKCLLFLLSLKAPKSAKEYLLEKHKDVSHKHISKRWQSYPSYPRLLSKVTPIVESDLSDPQFIKELAEKLSFDISRFTEFLEGYAKVAEDIKPVMLHYAMIYLLDFFSRTWLNYRQNASHGVKMIPQQEGQYVSDVRVKILQNGIFPRAVDAFFLRYQSSLFSNDEEHGIEYMVSMTNSGTYPPKMSKLSYDDNPQITLGTLLDSYERLTSFKGFIKASNMILTSYLVLFLVSSVSRYRAKDWFIIRNDRNLASRIELLRQDLISEWIPELILQKSLI